MSARPLNLLGVSEISRARDAVEKALAEWRRDWGIDAGATAVQCRRAWELDDRVWSCGDGEAWAGAAAALPDRLCETLFGRGAPQAVDSHASASLSREICGRAIDDMVRRLLAVFAPGTPGLSAEFAQAKPPAGLFEHASGALALDVEMAEGRVRIFARSGAREQSSAARASALASALTDPYSAVRDVPVILEAELGEVEMDLGMLQSLETGDVIRLPLRIDQALRVCGPNGATVCFGEFGAQESHRALYLRKSAVQEGV
jgi:flagellar motor switch/type III secretory pathway protein FliN